MIMNQTYRDSINKLSLYLIKHDAVKAYGRVEV
jgi:hypothetical protein